MEKEWLLFSGNKSDSHHHILLGIRALLWKTHSESGFAGSATDVHTMTVIDASTRTNPIWTRGEGNLHLVLKGTRDSSRSRGGEADEQGECEEERGETGCHAESE